MTTWPDWMLRLIAGLDQYDREHPKLYAQYAGSRDYQQADCPCFLIREVPADVLAYARGWAAGIEHATAKTEQPDAESSGGER